MEREATDLLARYSQAETHVLTQTNRGFTQELAGLMYDRGVAGVRYPSNVAEDACLALFEGRAVLRPVGEAQPLRPNGRMSRSSWNFPDGDPMRW